MSDGHAWAGTPVLALTQNKESIKNALKLGTPIGTFYNLCTVIVKLVIETEPDVIAHPGCLRPMLRA